MIITLTGATFSTSIGTLDSWFIQTSITGGGLTASGSNIKSIRKDDTAGATLTYTYDTENYKYTNGTVTDATGATVGSISGSNGTVTVTLNAGNTIKGKITIAILMEYIGSGEDGSTYTFTINPTPTSATVTLSATGYSTVSGTGSQNITVANGTKVNWTISADGYTTRTGNWTINGGNKTENVVLTASGGESSVSFTNDEFEIGALDGSGNPVALTTRYRTKNIKKFESDVLLTGKVLLGEINPAHVRVAQYNDNGTFVSMGQFADTATIPANTGFRLILERSAGGNVTRGDIVLTVPTGATRLYVNTLKTDKAISTVTTPRETIQGSTFKDGLYYYGTVGETVGTVTSSSKMAAYEGYLNVNAGETVTVNVYTSATLGCVFTDDTDKVILLGENSTFSGRDYQPLDFFTYEAQ